MMKTKFAILTVAILSVSVLMSPSAMAIDLSINVGDRPFYTDGPSYWDEGYEWVWIPGHREHHRWIHGHYERRGEFRKEYAHRHHHHDHDH
jgi:hypothetical protein